jgi:hypothetical protein
MYILNIPFHKLFAYFCLLCILHIINDTSKNSQITYGITSYILNLFIYLIFNTKLPVAYFNVNSMNFLYFFHVITVCNLVLSFQELTVLQKVD